MFQVSDRFKEALTTSHRVYSYVQAVSPKGQTLDLIATEGDVDVDRTADVRRRFSGTVLDPTGQLTPEKAGDILTPFGTYIYPYRGIMFDDGTTEMCPLGVFRLSGSSIKDDPNSLEISIEAYDKARTVQRDKFTSPYTINQGANVVSTIVNIVNRTFYRVKVHSSATWRSVTTQQIIDVDGDPWKTCQDLALSAGCEVYFDVYGDLVIAPIPNISNLSSEVFTYEEGANCVMLDLENSYSDEDAYNGVVVTGATPDAVATDEDTGEEETPVQDIPPVRAIVWDSDPRSVTYHLGPYGEYPMSIDDDTVTSVAQATMVARAKLNDLLGFHSTVGVTVLPNPAFEGGDIVKIVRERSKVDSRFVIDGFNVPLAASGTQSLKLRQKRIV